MDEPFSSLHANLRVQVRAEVKEILRASGTTAVLVTHDQEEALVMGDLVAIQRAGRLEQVDTPEAIFHAPATRFVASFMGMADFLPLHGVTEQEAGQPAIPTQAHAEPGPTPVELMVRPDDLLLVGNDVGNGVVTARTFQGPTYLYEVTLPHGNRVRCSTSHTERFAVGSRVSVRIHPDHPPLCFVNGRLVGAASRALIARLERDVLDTTG
jgi:iron(III) transport system ATP-binding protein